MILLNSEKQCIYMYKVRRAAAEEVSLGVIMTNTEIPPFYFHNYIIYFNN
jgi:hypothetical protein